MQSIAVTKDDLRNYFCASTSRSRFTCFAKNSHSVSSIFARTIVSEARRLENSPLFLFLFFKRPDWNRYWPQTHRCSPSTGFTNPVNEPHVIKIRSVFPYCESARPVGNLSSMEKSTYAFWLAKQLSCCRFYYLLPHVSGLYCILNPLLDPGSAYNPIGEKKFNLP